MLEVVRLYNMRVVRAGVQTSVEYIQFEHFPLLQRRVAALCVCLCVGGSVCVDVLRYGKRTLMHCLGMPWLWCCREGLCLFRRKGQINWLLISLECSNHLDWDSNHTLLADFDHLFTAVGEPQKPGEADRFKRNWWKPDRMFPSLSVPSKLTEGEGVGADGFFFSSIGKWIRCVL